MKVRSMVGSCRSSPSRRWSPGSSKMFPGFRAGCSGSWTTRRPTADVSRRSRPTTAAAPPVPRRAREADADPPADAGPGALSLRPRIRSLSKTHEASPFSIHVDGTEFRVGYEPGESTTALFGGNSNWRGPVWLPVNYLLIESLQKFHHFFGDSLKVEFPTGSGTRLNLWDVAAELSRR